MEKKGTKKGPAKRGTRKKGVPNHCSLSPVVLNAKEYQLCKVYVTTGSIQRTAEILRINWNTARTWLEKPKIKAVCESMAKQTLAKAVDRSSEQIALEAVSLRDMAVDVAVGAMQSKPHAKRGWADKIAGARLAFTHSDKTLDGEKGRPGIQIIGTQNNLSVDVAVEKLKSQQVYMPLEMRQKYGITDSPSDAIDAVFLAIDAKRQEAVAARRRAREGQAPLGT